MDRPRAGWKRLEHRHGSFQALALPTPGYPMQIIEPLRPRESEDAVVMIHGMEEGWDIWEQVTPRLEERWRLARLDLPWSGAQGYGWTYGRRSLADWIKLGLESLPARPRVLVAHSFGAVSVLHYLESYGLGEIQAVVLVSPFYLPPDKPFGWEQFSHYHQQFLPFLEQGVAARQSRDRQDPEIIRLMAEKVQDKMGPLGCLEFVYAFTRTAGVALDKLRLPILITGGEEDIYARASDCRELASRLPRCTSRLLPGCGHFSMIEQPEQLSEVLVRFLSEHFPGHPTSTPHPAENRS